MSEFEKAIEDLRKHRFKKSKKRLLKILEGNISVSEKVEVLQKLVTSTELSSHKNESALYIRHLAKTYVESNEFQKAVHEFSKLDEASLVQFIEYEDYWEACFESGLLESAFEILQKRADYLLERGNISRLKKFLERARGRWRSEEAQFIRIIEIKMMASGLEGPNLLELKDAKEEAAFLNMVYGKKRLWESWQNTFQYEEMNLRVYWERYPGKEVLKKIHFLIAYPDYLEKNKSVMKQIFLNYELKEAATSLNKLFPNSFTKDELTQVERMLSRKKIDMDAATDLFKVDAIEDLELKKQKLLTEIELLKEEGLPYQEKLEELNELSPDHSLVKEIYEGEYFAQGSKAYQSLNPRHRDKNIEELIVEIRHFSGLAEREIDREAELNKKVLIQRIINLKQKPFEDSFFDIITGLIMSQDYEGAEKILLHEKSKRMDRYKKQYLLCEVKLNLKKFYEVIDLVDEITGERGKCVGDNYIHFLYLKAEALYLLGKKLQAGKIFKAVVEVRPHYRLARFRFNEIFQH